LLCTSYSTFSYHSIIHRANVLRRFPYGHLGPERGASPRPYVPPVPAIRFPLKCSRPLRTGPYFNKHHILSTSWLQSTSHLGLTAICPFLHTTISGPSFLHHPFLYWMSHSCRHPRPVTLPSRLHFLYICVYIYIVQAFHLKPKIWSLLLHQLISINRHNVCYMRIFPSFLPSRPSHPLHHLPSSSSQWQRSSRGSKPDLKRRYLTPSVVCFLLRTHSPLFSQHLPMRRR